MFDTASTRKSCLIGVCIFHEISAGSNIGGVRALGNKFEGKGVARRSDTVCTCIIGAFDGTVLRTVGVGGACSLIPFISIVTVGVATDRVKPAPVSVDDNLTIDVGTAAASFTGAALPGHLWVRFSLLFPNDPRGSAGGAKGQDGCAGRRSKHHEQSMMLCLMELVVPQWSKKAGQSYSEPCRTLIPHLALSRL